MVVKTRHDECDVLQLSKLPPSPSTSRSVFIHMSSIPSQGAVLAVLTQLVCASFNRRIERGLPRDAPAIAIDFGASQGARETPRMG